jgi:hypothetical protein
MHVNCNCKINALGKVHAKNFVEEKHDLAFNARKSRQAVKEHVHNQNVHVDLRGDRITSTKANSSSNASCNSSIPSVFLLSNVTHQTQQSFVQSNIETQVATMRVCGCYDILKLIHKRSIPVDDDKYGVLFEDNKCQEKMKWACNFSQRNNCIREN